MAEWTYELKLDGYRMEVVRSDSAITLYSRRQNVLNEKFPYIASPLESLSSDFEAAAELHRLLEAIDHSTATGQSVCL